MVEKNTQNSLDNVPSINHNAKPYIIPLDIYKEGAWGYDISNYYKGRVNDNGTPFEVRWYEHGRLKNVQGLRPFMRGQVGKYTKEPDENGNERIVMANDATQIEVTGETTDCREGGIAIYRMIDQAFPQDGIFYGYIGLRGTGENGEIRETGVDVIFKVLGSHMNMLEARNYYVSELEQALLKFDVELDKHEKEFKERADQTIQAINDKITQEINNARSSLDNLQSEIRANRAEQENLTNRLVGTKQQIDENDIVTRPEFEKLDSRITDRLSKMDLTPHMYANEATMRAQNPNGTPDLCVTADTGHKWVWDYDNNNFVDAGAYNYALLDNGQNYLLGTNPNNEIPDPDFKATNSDFWFEAANGKPGTFTVDSDNAVDGSNIASITEAGDKGAWIQTHNLPVKGKKYSFRIFVNCRDTDVDAYLAVIFSNDTKDIFWNRVTLTNQSNDDFIKVEQENLQVPVGSTKWRMAVILPKAGTVKVYKPQLVFNSELKPYQSKYAVAKSDPNNLIPDPNFAMDGDFWTAEGNKVIPSFTIDKTDGIGNSNVAVLKTNGNGGSWIRSEDLPIENGKPLSFSVYANLQNSDQNAYAGFWTLDEGHKLLGRSSIDIQNSDDDKLKKYQFNNAGLADNVAFIRVVFTVQNAGILKVCRPEVNEGSRALPYSKKELIDTYSNALELNNPDNILRNSDFSLGNTGWYATSNGKIPEYNFDMLNGINNSGLVTVTGDEPKGFMFQSNSYDFGNHKVVSFSAYVAVDKVADGDQKPYISVWFDFANSPTHGVMKYFDNTDLELIKYENIQIPAEAINVRFALVGFNKQVLKMARPVISFTKKLNVAVPEQHDLPQLNINANEKTIGNDWVEGSFEYQNGHKILKGYVQIALQGDSSRGFAKKNYKIKLYEDKDYKDKFKIRPRSSFNKNNKWNLKANWIDATQARNLVNARIFEKATDVTPFENDTVAKKLSQGQAMGQMEGFPIELYLDGNYNGLYTWNTKKDEKFFGMDSDNVGEEIIVFESPGSQLKTTTAKFDGTDYSTEVQDEATPELKANFNKFLKFLNTSSDEDIKNHLKDYIDVHSVINTYLYGILAMVWDTSGKSNLLITYNNGQYFYMLPYDMDSTWGLKPDGSVNKVPLPEYDFANIGKSGIMQFVTEEGQMKIFNVIYKLFKPEMIKQYKFLRQNVWSNSTMIDEFKKFIDSIPQAAYEREQEKWPQIPSIKKGDFEQIQSAIIQRGSAMDKWIDSLDTENDPITNLQAQIDELKQNGTSK